VQEDCSFNVSAIDNIVGAGITVVKPTSEDILAVSSLVILASWYICRGKTDLVLLVDLL
jgi:hypothetical protein